MHRLDPADTRTRGPRRGQGRLVNFVLLVWCGSIACCAPSAEQTVSWLETANVEGTRELGKAASFCDDCIRFHKQLTLGDDGEGFLVGVGENHGVLRDGSGNYWVGQRGTIKIYDQMGDFAREVGRAGQGPMEFLYARPSHVDGLGRVHVLDHGNLRETIIGPDFQLVDDKPLPARFDGVAPLSDGDSWVFQVLIQSPERLGLPLHIIRDGRIRLSFGVSTVGDAQPLTESNTARHLATDEHGRIFSVSKHSLSVEVFSATGERIGGLQGPDLEEEAAPTTMLPPNMVAAIHVDHQSRLWILSHVRQENWLENLIERVAPDGRVALVPKEDAEIQNIYDTRLDVVDLSTASIVASGVHDEVIWSFLPDGTASGPHFDESGNFFLNIWTIDLAKEGGAATE